MAPEKRPFWRGKDRLPIIFLSLAMLQSSEKSRKVAICYRGSDKRRLMGVAIAIDPFQASSLWPFFNIKIPSCRHSIKSLSSPEKETQRLTESPNGQKYRGVFVFSENPIFFISEGVRQRGKNLGGVVVFFIPIGSMYGIFTYIYHQFKPNIPIPWILNGI